MSAPEIKPRRNPSEFLGRDFRSIFGWWELEAAALRIVIECAENSDCWRCVSICDMFTDVERRGFTGLISQGFLETADLDGRGGPWIFDLTDAFFAQLETLTPR